MRKKTKKRCSWVDESKLDYVAYHDKEWGVAVHDDKVLFEYLILEGAQAGLSWYTILKRREGYRKAFKGFDPKRVAAMTDKELEALMQDEGIIRNRLKIWSTRDNANAFLAIQQEFGSFDAYLWRYVDGKTVINNPNSMNDIAVTSEVSDALSKDLKKRGMRFVGSTIIYAFMQAVGMVDDHEVRCFRK